MQKIHVFCHLLCSIQCCVSQAELCELILSVFPHLILKFLLCVLKSYVKINVSQMSLKVKLGLCLSPLNWSLVVSHFWVLRLCKLSTTGLHSWPFFAVFLSVTITFAFEREIKYYCSLCSVSAFKSTCQLSLTI